MTVDLTSEVGCQGVLPVRVGRYEVKRILGRGGFGTVYLAHDPQLERPVAIKMPREDRFEAPGQVESFLCEAKTAASLSHPLLVTVYDVQEEHGRPYIVQEFIDGPSFDEWAGEYKPTFEQLAEMLATIAEAISFAHERGLTHCDLKMSNILIDKEARPHIADFGLAVTESSRTFRRGRSFGTPAMMSPEQVRGEGHRLDGRTDVWAVGVMMYQLLTGRYPFLGNHKSELLKQIETMEPKPPRQIEPNVPKELERICLKCLAKRRTDRYQLADDLREDLIAWLSNVATQPSGFAFMERYKVHQSG